MVNFKWTFTKQIPVHELSVNFLKLVSVPSAFLYCAKNIFVENQCPLT